MRTGMRPARVAVLAAATLAATASAAVLAARAAQAPGGASAAPAFEAAAIAPVPPDARVPLDIRFLPGGVIVTNLTLDLVIARAYGIETYEIVGGPSWLRTDRFNITATAPGPLRREQAQLMLQKLLVDRFRLDMLRETRPGTVYTLTTRGAHRLKPPAALKEGDRPLIQQQNTGANGYLSYRYVGMSATMEMLARELSLHLSAPVSDGTNINGAFDFSIDFTYDKPFNGRDPDPNVPTIFTAMEQVGLRLVAGTGPVSVYRVNRLERPTEN